MSDETCRHGTSLKGDCEDCETVVRLTAEVRSLTRQLLRSSERAQRAEDNCDLRTNEREVERSRAEKAESEAKHQGERASEAIGRAEKAEARVAELMAAALAKCARAGCPTDADAARVYSSSVRVTDSVGEEQEKEKQQ